VVEEGTAVVTEAEPETEEVFDSTAEVDEATGPEDGAPLLTDSTDVAGGGTSPLEAGGGGT
jgi:hypothetical protein